MERSHRIGVSTANGYYYDPEVVAKLYADLRPAPDRYGDDPVYALWLYLHGSEFGSDVFEDQGDFDQWPDSDGPVSDR